MSLFGLPLHPLVVHAAVVLLPLAALGALLIAVSKRARIRYGSLVVVVAVVATGAVVGARITGEALNGGTQGTGILATHITYGLLAPWPAGALALTSLLLVLAGRTKSRLFLLITAWLTVVSALASLAIILVVGHAGATAVWAGRG
ncbi:MAG: DUF2231 domain-containing protein [Propionicimonas sp.]